VLHLLSYFTEPHLDRSRDISALQLACSCEQAMTLQTLSDKRKQRANDDTNLIGEARLSLGTFPTVPGPLQPFVISLIHARGASVGGNAHGFPNGELDQQYDFHSVVLGEECFGSLELISLCQ
jgi:hypothetical protein